MSDSKVIIKLKELVAFDVEYIKRHLSKTDNENYFNAGVANSMIELLIQLLILEEYEKVNHWLVEVKKFYSGFFPNNKLDDIEESNIILYTYIINIMSGKEVSDYINKYADFFVEYYENNYKLNKSNYTEYEELVVYLVAARDYNRAKKYTTQLLKVKKGGLVNVIDRYLDIRKKDEPLDSLIKECRSILNRRRGKLAYVLSQGFAYFLFYYRELLKSDNVEELVKAMVFGIK